MCCIGRKKRREIKQQQHSTPRVVMTTSRRSPASRLPTKSPTTTATPHKQQSSTLETGIHFSKSAPTLVAAHSGPRILAHHSSQSLSPPPVQVGNDDEVRLRELFNILRRCVTMSCMSYTSSVCMIIFVLLLFPPSLKKVITTMQYKMLVWTEINNERKWYDMYVWHGNSPISYLPE